MKNVTIQVNFDVNDDLSVKNLKVEVIDVNTHKTTQIKTVIKINKSQKQYYYLRFKQDSGMQEYITPKSPIEIVYNNKKYTLTSHKEVHARIDGLSDLFKNNPELDVDTELEAILEINKSPLRLTLKKI